ncbi:N-acetylmuramoyl-L-alanine amidase [Chryseobacterium culicis]|jgi:N-acetylmuramoyl-L-alanine amidase|uniref:N-acetylmuramoyl-L-alanine amidase n=1 Tax=Chryseobacterium culicis TaxID=680127 RepID=A0A1H6HJY8_CHRCI|nr:N-acetylmuramoyl-L-alanine amidase [Chryseobacterium culicis]MBE4950011.1 N-acetylmuramoyl-L-alanine amidase [Chryseobacterium culicis]SEH34528.1 N-acetylmuramoyl-L-alanine amidase [Chryseobacterium culicis]
MIIIKDKLGKTISGESISFIETPNKEGIIIPEYIIIHFTAGRGAENSINWFKDPTAKASAHVIIDSDGRITQMVEFNKKAWHAGRSRWADRSGFNDFSIGIELENPGRLTKVNERFYAWFEKEYSKDVVVTAKHKHENETSYWHSFTEKQLETCFQVCKLLMETYHIKNILGHDDIAPFRKNDPGPAFPMENFRAKLLGREDDTADMYKVNAEYANVRNGAGTEFEAIVELKKDTQVEFIQSKLGWFYVYVLFKPGKDGEPIYGWINSDLLKKI